MKRETIVICILAMLAVSGIAVAAEGDISFDTTWVSKYLWRGFDLTDDKAAIQPSVNIDLGSGLSANVWASYGGASNTVNATEYDYTLTYSGTACEDTTNEMAYALSWVYYDFIDGPSSDADAQEINLSIAMPSLCPNGIVPSYTIVKIWASESDSASSSLSGWFHVVGLDYGLNVGNIFENNPEQVINLSMDATYNGSAGLPGSLDKSTGAVTRSNVDHDWSHITLGASTAIELPGAGTLTPAIYYQISMDKSVNPENELWTGVSWGFTF
ncbi:MAG: hypothetical protein FVQ82_17580 [Planctomycetes bacterium]|nr:hypothetical protein [Planctomycetota bacterium]